MSTHGTCVPTPPCFSLTQSPSQGRHKDTFPTVRACCGFSHQPRAFQQGQDRDQLVPPCPAWERSPAASPDAGSSWQVPKPRSFPLHLPRDGGYTLLSRGFQPQHDQVAPSSTHPCRSIPDHTRLLSHTGPDPKGNTGCCAGGDRLPAPSSLPGQPLGLSALFRASHKQTAKISEVTWHRQSAHGVSLRVFPPASPSAPATPMCCIQP